MGAGRMARLEPRRSSSMHDLLFITLGGGILAALAAYALSLDRL